jgi:hypothetical protein
MTSLGTRALGTGRAKALDLDRGLINSESIFRYCSHKPLHDAAFMHLINMAAVVAYCENGGIVPVLRVGAGHIRVH